MTAPAEPLSPGERAEEEAWRINMHAFDRLPAPYRDLIRNAPIDIPATTARAYLAAFGEHLGLRLLKWAVMSRAREKHRRGGEAERGLGT